MSGYEYRSSFETIGEDDKAPDIIYYNGDIINNSTDTSTYPDPQIRFNETRDVPLISDASLYNFSIVRFTMNGSGKDLPLFIPQIDTRVSTNPTLNVDKTVYSANIRADLTFTDNTGTNQTRTIFSTDVLTSLQDYGIPIFYEPEITIPLLAPIPAQATITAGQQDVSTRYYWVYSYAYWLRLVNAMLAQAQANIQTRFNALWSVPVANGGWGRVAGTAPILGTVAPYLTYNPTTNLFTLYADSYGYGYTDGTVPPTVPTSLQPFPNTTMTSVSTSQANTPSATIGREAYRLYFNANMFGLFNNYKSLYGKSYWATNAEQYYEILINNLNFANVYTTPVIPPSVLPQQSIPSPSVQKAYWVVVQDYESTSTLWNPIASLVFTSGFLPIVNEATGAPIRLGTTNLGTSSATVPSAFQPIITDVALANQSAHDYRGFINYTPTAEYRITSFQRGKNDIRQIDIQVWWKNRMDGKLYPVQMYNLSSVSIKIMFRKKGLSIHGLGKGDRNRELNLGI